MKSLAFAARNRKELLRDPLNLTFGLGFPLVLMLLLSRDSGKCSSQSV